MSVCAFGTDEHVGCVGIVDENVSQLADTPFFIIHGFIIREKLVSLLACPVFPSKIKRRIYEPIENW